MESRFDLRGSLRSEGLCLIGVRNVGEILVLFSFRFVRFGGLDGLGSGGGVVVWKGFRVLRSRSF